MSNKRKVKRMEVDLRVPLTLEQKAEIEGMINAGGRAEWARELLLGDVRRRKASLLVAAKIICESTEPRESVHTNVAPISGPVEATFGYPCAGCRRKGPSPACKTFVQCKEAYDVWKSTLTRKVES